MLLNCGVGEDSWSPLECKEIRHRGAVNSTVGMGTRRVTIIETQRVTHQRIKKWSKISGVSAMSGLVVAHAFHYHYNNIIIV